MNSSTINDSSWSNFTPPGPPRCMRDTQPYLASLLMVIVPVLVVAGVVGNILNLIVLNSKGMKTKTNFVLSAMAAADLAHAVVAMLVNLHLYERLIDSDAFSRFYHHQLKLITIVLVNWMSMLSTWLAVAVTVERLIAIRSPLKARSILRKRYIIAVVVFLTIFSLVVCSYYLFWMRPRVLIDCDDRNRRIYRLFPERSLWLFGHISRKIHAVLCSLIPVILLFVCNGLLVYHLRRNHATMEMFNENSTTGTMAATNGNTHENGQQPPPQQPQERRGSIVIDTRREYQVAVVVIVISLTAACLLLPSAALVIYDGVRVFIGLSPLSTLWWYFAAGDISNVLILFEKVLDFFLYCLTSGYFRRRLVAVLCYSTSAKHKRRQGGANGMMGGGDTPKPLLSRAMRMRLKGKPPLLKRQSTQSTLVTFASVAAGRLRRLTATSTTSASSGQSVNSKKLDENGGVHGHHHGHQHHDQCRPTPPRLLSSCHRANSVNEEPL